MAATADFHKEAFGKALIASLETWVKANDSVEEEAYYNPAKSGKGKGVDSGSVAATGKAPIGSAKAAAQRALASRKSALGPDSSDSDSD